MFGSAAAALGTTFTASGVKHDVIGVVADNHHYGADQEYGTAVYLPASAIPFAPGRVHMAVRTDRKDDRLYDDLRRAIWSAEPDLPVPTIRSLEEWAKLAGARRRFDSALFIVFGSIALLLAAGGLAGTLFYMVNLQRRDLGIRLALGATSRGLERLVLTRGIAMAAIGVLIGGSAAWAAGRVLQSQLFGVNARDPRTLGLAMAVLMAVAFISSWIPAQRAAATNPVESLRAD
jgi:predicted lysophospholipase L1 biosynthesis ABC-type transport system permease subunit